MNREIIVAAIQISARVGQVLHNLNEAEAQVRRAAATGAQLIVLPELFNTGYKYTADNYQLAEWRDGRTWRWLTGLAAELNVHLAGSFLLRKGGDIFNTLLLAAPDGRTWEYDKSHPFFWERAYFRPGQGALVAETELGRIGFLICWDVAFPQLFAQYAGQVDLLLISSCPPAFQKMNLRLPGGRLIKVGEGNPINEQLQRDGERVFSSSLAAQVRYLQVPAVHAGPAPGLFQSPLPRPFLTYLVAMLPTPKWLLLWPQAAQGVAEMPFVTPTGILNEQGIFLAADETGLALAQLNLPPTPPVLPTSPPPPAPMPDWFYKGEEGVHWLMRPLYDHGIGRTQGRRWARWLLVAAAILYFLYRRGRRKG